MLIVLFPNNAKSEILVTPSVSIISATLLEDNAALLPLPSLTEKPEAPNLLDYGESSQSIDVQKNKIPTTSQGKTIIWEDAMVWQNNDNKSMTVDAYSLSFHIKHTMASGEQINYHDEWFEEIKSGTNLYEESPRFRKAKDLWDTIEADISEQNAKIMNDYYLKLERYKKSRAALAIAEKINQEMQEHRQEAMQFTSK